MPQATSIDQLLELEDAIEDGARQILRANGVTNVYIQRDDENTVNPRVEIQLVPGKNSGVRLKDNHGSYWPAAWEGLLGFRIVTKRSKDKTPQVKQTHRQIRAIIRRVLLECDSNGLPVNFTTGVLPYHCITKCLDQHTAPMMREENDEDVSEMHFSIAFNIRSNAFPS